MRYPKKSMAGIGLLLFFLSSSFFLHGEVRNWTDVQGRIIRADFLKLEAGIVHLRLKNGKIGKVPLEKLGADDQAYLKKANSPSTSDPKPQPKIDAPEERTPKWPNDHGVDPPTPIVDWSYPKGTAARIYIEKAKFYHPDGELLFDGVDFVRNEVKFHHGYAMVKVSQPDRSWAPALMDPSGKFIIGGKGGAPLPEGTKALGKYGGDGLIAFGVQIDARSNKYNWGYLDLSGKVVLEPKWSFALPFVNGLAPVSEGETKLTNNTITGLSLMGSYHFIDKTGAKAIEGDWHLALPFDRFGHAFVLPKSKTPKVESPWLAINTQGKLWSPPVLLSRKWSYHHERLVIENQLIDMKGNILFKAPKGYTLRDCTDHSGVCILRSYEKGKKATYRFVDRVTGKCYGPTLEYKSLLPFQEGYAKFETHDKKVGLIDREGQVVIGPHPGWGRSLENGFYRAEDRERGVIEIWSIKTRSIFKSYSP
jgi:hypothetical protein